MPSSAMLRRVALIRTDISEKHIASIIRILRRATRRNIPEDGIHHSHRRVNLKCYKNPWPRIIPTERPPLVDEI
jgi:hypothetical protein